MMMSKKEAIQVFEDKQVRTLWDAEEEKWYFSIIDVIAILSGSDRPRKYWSDLKTKLKNEGSELSDKIGQLKMQSSDGKYYKTDVVDTEQLFRLIQSIPFATLTDIISKTWSGKTTKEYKVFKGLKKENLRDNMTNTELILNMLAEASTKDISQAVEPKNFEESKKVAREGGTVAKVALKELESKTGKKVVSPLNVKTALELNHSKETEDD